MAEIGNLCGRLTSHSLERRIERACITLDSGGRHGADGHRAARQGPQQRARGMCKGRHRGRGVLWSIEVDE